VSKIDILSWKKEKVGTIELSPEVFNSEIRKDILHTVVNWQLACRRQGTAMVKTRSLVSGGGKKPFKQKGTGGARQGSTRSPLMPGGAKLFGPQPRTYDFDLPKKVRRLGLRMALSHLNKEGRLFVVENMKSEGKSKELVNRLKTFGVNKAVLIDTSSDEKFKRASSNLSGYKYFSVDGLNVFDLLKYTTAVITKDSVAKITERCQAE
jgi:large subunit ribosomal protein L4